ncbi:MAG: hypothetical protein GY830_11130 [Bacteroidetes bacterium]|nr:hypothetical protein [Bacteroidota bacterium]
MKNYFKIIYIYFIGLSLLYCSNLKNRNNANFKNTNDINNVDKANEKYYARCINSVCKQTKL